MQESSITSFLTSFISALIGQGTKQFTLNVVFRGEIYRGGEGVNVPARFATILVDGRSNYVGVWTRISTEPKSSFALEPSDFTFQSCHDSCWRSDGMRWVFQNFCEMRDELSAAVQRDIPAVRVGLHELNDAITLRPDIVFFRAATFERRAAENGYEVLDIAFE